MKTVNYPGRKAEELISRTNLDYNQVLESVRPIVEDVRKNGDKALTKYTRKFDKYSLSPGNMRVTEKEIKAASQRIPTIVKALKKAHKNIKAFHSIQYKEIDAEWDYYVEEGVKVGEKTTPLKSVGCYAPGGLASYPSTVLMNCVPAKIAGVERIAVASPPPIPDAVLAAAKIAGADEVYRMGGAQAIAALAYGTRHVQPVDKIVGPGNKYVTAAKMLVYGTVDIDMPAGPSEILIIADSSAKPSIIASDLLAQAEHDPNAQCILATDSPKLVKAVNSELEAMIRASGRSEILKKSRENMAAVIVKNKRFAVEYANKYAPEHLEILVKNPTKIAAEIRNAGAVFLGPYSPVAAGDYASGGNHVLPTSGAARFSSPLSVRDFLKTTCVQEMTKEGLKRLSNTIITLAQEEGLLEHRKSVQERLK
ncbi:MAG: histidinol dehydrogenase [Candidatus Altiarchaeota archaeon]